MLADINRRFENRSRRDLLRVIGAGGVAGVAGLAGCLDGGGDGSDVDPVEDRVEVDPDDIVEGGTFRTAVQGPPDSFDYGYSSQAYATILMNLLYEGMIGTGADGTVYSWLAENYEQVELQDVGPADYEQYMVEVPYQETEDGQRFAAAESQIVVQHPDNDPENDDQARVLTVEEAPDAVADGVYGMDIRFDLHEGVTFHTGEELTADDVVASYRRIEGSSLSGQLFDSLLDIQADGDYTVHIYVQEPDAAAVRELGGWPVHPRELAELPGGDLDPREGNTPVGTGPFELDTYEHPEYAIFTRNEDYWFDTELKDWFDGDEAFPNGPVVDEVDVSFVPDPSQRSAALQNDELDMAFGLTFGSLDDYQNSENYRTAATQGAGYNFLQFPVHVPPFDDARVRRAVNHMIPRQQIADDIFSGWESPAWIPLPPLARREGATDYDQLVEDLREYNEYDQERAEELIDEAGVDTPVEIVIETNADDDDRVAAVELVVEALNQSDYFDATVEEVADINTAVIRYTDDEYYQQGRLVWIGLSGGFDPHGYAKAVHHPDNFAQCCNFQDIDDQELNDLLRQARYGVDVAQDDELRQERYEAVWERVLELNANSYGTHSMTISVVDDRDVHGWNTYPSTQNVVGYGLYAPMDEQITYIDRE